MKSSVNDFKMKSTNLCFLNDSYAHWQIPFTVLIREASFWTAANTDSRLFRVLRISEHSVLNSTFISPTQARQPHRTLYQMWMWRMHSWIIRREGLGNATFWAGQPLEPILTTAGLPALDLCKTDLSVVSHGLRTELRGYSHPRGITGCLEILVEREIIAFSCVPTGETTRL